MTPEAIRLVKESWKLVDTSLLVEQFYAELFAAEPSVKSLFQTDTDTQKDKFDATVSEIIEHLGEPSGITEHVRTLGISHAGYGVFPRHYVLMEKVLIKTLEEHLGANFDVDTKQAWHDAYQAIANGMQDAAMDNDVALGR